ncbi:MAG: diguanylate cyclase [Candidatus Ozemobacteraceae bacterium]
MLCLFIFLLVAVTSLLGLFDGLEVKTLDMRFRQRPLAPPDDRIIILAITDECIAQLGKWPWPRSRHADILDMLKKAGASAAVFDLIFQDTSDREPREDERLIESCASFGKVLLPIHLVPVSVVNPESLELTSEVEVCRPFDRLASVACGFGFINVDYQNLNSDGIIRCIPLTLSAQGSLFPALPLAVAREIHGETGPLIADPVVIANRTVPQTLIPAITHGEKGWRFSSRPAYLVNYLGEATSGAFPMVYYADLFNGMVNPSIFKNRIVLVGPTATGLSDVKLSPFGEMPGVMIHATVLQNLLKGNFLNQTGPGARFLILLFLSLATWYFLIQLNPLIGTIALAGMVILYNFVAFQLFMRAETVIDMVAPTMAMGVQFTAGRFLQMFTNLKDAYRSIKERSEALEESNRLLDRQVTDLSTLNEVGNRFSALLAMEPLSREILLTFQELWGASTSLVAMVEGDDSPLKVIGQYGIGEDDGRLVLFDPEVSMTLRLLREERRFLFTPSGKWFTCYLPLLMGTRLWGALLLKETLPNPTRFHERESFCMTLLGIAATALENARLYNLATVDLLTRLFVRQYFQIQIEQEFKRAKRYGHNLALLMTDIDHFKIFNDSYGHQQGDIVLREVAAAVRKSLREIDIPARYGGEEFSIVLPETNLDGALIVAERIRRNVELMLVPRSDTRGEPLRVMISIGVSAIPEHSLDSPETMIKLADQALYCAKERGRNRVEYITPK